MKQKVLLPVMLLVLSLSFLYYAVDETTSESSSVAIVSFDRPTIEIMVCRSFETRISVANVTGLSQYVLVVSFNNTLLWVLEAKNGTSNATNLEFFAPVDENGVEVPLGNSNTTGVIRLKGRYYTPVSGNETLAILKFKCHNIGNSDLTILPDPQTKLYTALPGPIHFGPPPPCKCKQAMTQNSTIPITEDFTLCNDITYTGGGVFFDIKADNVELNLNGFRITGQTGMAIQAVGRRNICIKNGNLSGFQQGVYITNCTNVTISNMGITQPIHEGIYISQRTSEFSIIDCTFGLQKTGESIYVFESDYGIISNNVLHENNYGISLIQADNCTIMRNILKYNNVGISLNTAHNNSIFNNDFVQSTTNHTELIGSPINNTWNAVYPRGGNYWDDYEGNDDFSGKNLTAFKVLGPDGIGDTVYKIDDNNLDQYPLMHGQDSLPKLNVFGENLTICYKNGTKTPRTCLVALYTDSIISSGSFFFDRTWNNETNSYDSGSISFNVTRGTFCKAIISRELLDGGFEVLMNDVPTACFLNWEGGRESLTCVYVYANLTYQASDSERTIRIKGQVATTLEGDVDGNGKVNIIDVSKVAKQFGNERK